MQHQIQQVVSNVVLGLRIVQQTEQRLQEPIAPDALTKVKMSDSNKKANTNTYDIISSTKLVSIGSFTL